MQDNKKKLNIKEFLKLPIKKQEKIMSKIAGKANEDQRDLVERYEKQFGYNYEKQAG